MARLTKPRPVLVEWVDSSHLAPGTWVDREDACELGPCGVVTVGWLIGKTATYLTIASSITEADDVTGTFVIPRAVVARMERLSP